MLTIKKYIKKKAKYISADQNEEVSPWVKMPPKNNKTPNAITNTSINSNLKTLLALNSLNTNPKSVNPKIINNIVV